MQDMLPIISGQEQPKAHLSQTQMDLCCKCGEAYRRRYMEGQKIPPGIAILKGKATDSAATVNFTQKIETYRDLRVRDMVDAAVESFETAIKGEFVLTSVEASRGPSVILGETKDAIAELATVHGTQQAIDYQPIAVQKQFRIELPNAARDLIGIIDLVDDQDRVTDFKAGGKTHPANSADDSVQLSVYCAGFEYVYGRPAREARLDILAQTKSGTRRQLLRSDRGPSDFSALAQRINVINATIDAGIFLPATPGAWWCSEKWCGYWRTCRYVNSERKAKSEDD